MVEVDAEQRLQWARECCRAVGLDPDSDVSEVIELAEQNSEDWPECCDGGCQPCAAVLQSAALALKRRLAR
jgi:hypothetical protein